jgi:hypothetical protein
LSVDVLRRRQHGAQVQLDRVEGLAFPLHPGQGLPAQIVQRLVAEGALGVEVLPLDRERAPDRRPEDCRCPPLGIDGLIGPGVRGGEACHRLAEAPGPLVGGRDPQPRPLGGAAPRHR